MRSFRSLGGIPDRMGLTFEDGGVVQGLPYAEGQLLATAIDDWRRVRLEPQLFTYAARLSFAAGGAGNFNLCSLQARTLPIRLIYVDVDNPTVAPGLNGETVKMARLAAPLPIDGIGFAVALPLEAPGFGLDEPTARFVNHGTVTTITAPISTSPGVGLVIKPTSAWFGHGIGRLFPRVLLPGEAMLFQQFTANATVSVSVAWEELPSTSDVVTSQAKEAGIQL